MSRNNAGNSDCLTQNNSSFPTGANPNVESTWGPFTSLLSSQMWGKAWTELPNVVAQSNLHLWQPSDPITGVGEFLLVGVSVACLHDLRLLDSLDISIDDGSIGSLQVGVFDWTDLKPDILEPYAIDLGTPYHSPLAGIWKDGEMILCEWGYTARQAVCERYNIPMDEILAR